MERPKIVVLEWEDPNSSSGWTDPDKLDEMDPSMVISVGLLVREDSDWMWLCMDWSKDGEVNTVGRIRQELIKKRKELKLPRGIWPETYPKKSIIKKNEEKIAAAEDIASGAYQATLPTESN